MRKMDIQMFATKLKTAKELSDQRLKNIVNAGKTISAAGNNQLGTIGLNAGLSAVGANQNGISPNTSKYTIQQLNAAKSKVNDNILPSDHGGGGRRNNDITSTNAAESVFKNGIVNIPSVQNALNAINSGINVPIPQTTKETVQENKNNNITYNTTAPQYVNPYAGMEGSYLDKLKELTNQTNIVSKDAMDKINTPFKASQAYIDAMAYTNSLLEKLSSGRTSYTDQLNALMNDIKNREKFQYDIDSDLLFQQSLASYMANGANAMQDTMAQAAALTGGYGSSYATSAANQAYNAYIQDAYSNLPQYYNMALDAYNAEGDEMYRQYAMLSDEDMKEYERNYNAFTNNLNLANDMYGKEYNEWADEVKNALNMANLQMSENQQLFQQNYNMANMLNDEYWKSKQFNESIRQYENNFNQSKAEFDTNMKYKYDALENGNEQWLKEYQLAMDKAQQASDKKEAGHTLSSTEMQKALDAYNKGGFDALDAYTESFGYLDNAELERITNYVTEHMLDMGDRTYTKTDDNLDWPWSKGKNDIYVDQYGNEYTWEQLKDLPDSVKKNLKKISKDESYTGM